MECERFEEMLDRLFDETKSLTATDEMKKHMAECASCRNLYRLKEALLPIGECEEEELPEDIAGVLYSAIQNGAASGPQEQIAGNPSRWTRWASLAAAAVILVAGGTVLMRGIDSPKDANHVATSVVYGEQAAGEAKNAVRAEDAAALNESSFPVTSATCAPTARNLSSLSLPQEDAEAPSLVQSGTYALGDAPAEEAPKVDLGEEMMMAASDSQAMNEDCEMPAIAMETREEYEDCEESVPAGDYKRADAKVQEQDIGAITAWAEECGGRADGTAMPSGCEDENNLCLLIPESNLDAFLEGLTEMGIEEGNVKIDPQQDGVTEIEGVPYVKVWVYTAG